MKGKSSSKILTWLLPKQTGHRGGQLTPLSLAKNIFYLFVLEANVHMQQKMQEPVMRNFTVLQILLSNC